MREIVRRVLTLILTPSMAWDEIAEEVSTVDQLIRRYIVPLALLAPIATVIGMKTFDASWDPAHGYLVPDEHIWAAGAATLFATIVSIFALAAIFVLIAAAIGFAFTRGAREGTDALLTWILCTGGLAMIGAIAAAAHPLSAISAFIAAPLKPFRPGVPASAISAGVEAWLRKPRVADFDTLRDDVSHWTGWWKNRIARTLLNFMFVTIGTILGEYIAGIRIIRNLF